MRDDKKLTSLLVPHRPRSYNCALDQTASIHTSFLVCLL